MAPIESRANPAAVGSLAIGLVVARRIGGGAFDVLAFAVAAWALFIAGRPLRRRAAEDLKRFRITAPTAAWLAAGASFWVSVAVWFWWNRRSPTFPLFLLGPDLNPRFPFPWVPLWIGVGLYLDSRDRGKGSGI